MKKIKFWAQIALPCMALMQWAHWLILGSFTGMPSLSMTDVGLSLDVVGVVGGLSILILWLGKRLPLPNRVMFFLLVLGWVLYFVLFIYGSDQLFNDPGNNLMVMLAPMGLVGILWLLGRWVQAKGEEKIALRHVLDELKWLIVLNLSLGMGTAAALDISMFVLPNVMDYDIYRIDRHFVDVAAAFRLFFEQGAPWFQTLVYTMYSLLSVCLYLTVALVWRENRQSQVHIFRTLIVPFGVAYIFYALMPAAGPIYAFGQDYPLHMPNVADLPSGLFPIPPAFRNAMPSMHLSGAIFIWLLAATLKRKVFFYCATAYVFITFFTTMGLGEHYLLEMIVALPFALSLGSALMNPPGWQFNRNPWWYATVLTFAVWVVLLIGARSWLIQYALLAQGFSVWSTLVSSILAYQFLKLVWHLPLPQTEHSQTADLVIPDDGCVAEVGQGRQKWVTGLFIASGFAGLLYEVVFAKSLAVTFGATSLAAYTVMATYMGGMALGAWLGGMLADKVKNSLFYYAIFEALIGVYALSTPILFQLIQQFYVSIAVNYAPDSPVLTLWRTLLGSVSLGIPTILMGTTLPIMFKYLQQNTLNTPDTAQTISRLYTANVIGAASGALVGAYVVLPVLGRLGSTYLAALLSLMIALYALDKIKQHAAMNVATPLHATQAAPVDTDLRWYSAQSQRRILGWAALCVITLGGMVTLALEVVNMHMLAAVAGNSVYAFGLMLATFLLGLALGSWAFPVVVKQIAKPLVIVVAQLGLGISILFTGLLWDRLADYFASFGYMLQFIHFGFAARELIRSFVCAIVMVPPAFFIGLSYPAAMDLVADLINTKPQQQAKGIGVASLFNTFGNILGVLIAGFWLLDAMGSNRFMLLLAMTALLLAILMLLACWRGLHWNQVKRYGIGLLLALFGLSIWAYPHSWNYQQLSTGANVYFYPVQWGKIIAHTESVDGGITSVAQNGANLTLLTNGKFQGNNTGEVAAQESFALVPMMHTPNRNSALIIGYGTGMSAYVLHQQGFKSVDVVEISKDIVRMADQYFGDINQHVTSQPGVRLYFTDGRNYLLTQNKRYDVISMEITSIWFAGAANLYNREFYQIARQRLTNDGVLQQWVQLHHITPMDLLYIINTARSEFKNVWFYVEGGQGILIASNKSNGANNLFALSVPQKAQNKNQWYQREQDLRGALLLNPEAVDNIRKKLKFPQSVVSNDNNLYLEYSTPKGNAITDDVLERNVQFLRKISSSH